MSKIPTVTPEQREAMSARKRFLSGLTPDERISEAKLSLSGPRRRLVADRLSQMPETCRANYLKAVRGKSLAAAVKSFCGECVCWNRREVEKCTALACPLYAVRPFQGLLEEETDDE